METAQPAGGRTHAATLKDVAARAGVSIRTVSNVANDYRHVSPETRRKVQKAIDELDYRPQAAARQLRRGTTDLVTLAVPGLRFSYFAELAQEFIDHARPLGLTVLLQTTGGTAVAERAVVDGGAQRIGDGTVFNPLRMSTEYLTRSRHLAQPMLLIGEHVNAEDLPLNSDYVRIDNVRATYEATRHLITSGRRRIAFLGAIESQAFGSATLRLEGFAQALAEAGLEASDVRAVPDWYRSAGVDSIPALLHDAPDTDAIVCGNDDLAIGALQGLAGAGVRVPGDVAVIGYDGVPMADYTTPQLSTIEPDRAFLAKIALTMLTERISGYAGPPRVVTTPYQLVLRESA